MVGIIASILVFVFFTAFLTLSLDPDLSKKWKIIMALVMMWSFIGLMVCGYFRIIEKSEENNQKIEMVSERIKYNEKKQNELLTEKFKLPVTDILIEPVSETEYYKVTTNTGIYKVAFAYDSNDRIIGFKEFKQITSTASEGGNN